VFAYVVFSWLFSSTPLFITGFIGVTASIILNLAPAAKLFSSFGHPIIFLFLGGFLLAKAFNNVGLDKRIPLYLLTRSFIKGSMTRLLFTLMLLTATFTMWISNTATTAMMLPLVLGTLSSLKIESKKTISLVLICIA
jgi:sodium-dependent dicarboxylate transporter 2/3/5